MRLGKRDRALTGRQEEDYTSGSGRNPFDFLVPQLRLHPSNSKRRRPLLFRDQKEGFQENPFDAADRLLHSMVPVLIPAIHIHTCLLLVHESDFHQYDSASPLTVKSPTPWLTQLFRRIREQRIQYPQLLILFILLYMQPKQLLQFVHIFNHAFHKFGTLERKFHQFYWL